MMRITFFAIAFVFFLNLSAVYAKKDTLIVAKDGSGTHNTIQNAFDAIALMEGDTITMIVKAGVYKERLFLRPSTNKVHMIGEDAHHTILSYDNYARKVNPETGQAYGTTGSSSFFVEADDFTAENITFANSSGPVGQAVAVNITGNRVAFRNCRFLGFQDTLYTKGPQDDSTKESVQYFENCYIEGTVDYIFGAATVLFVACELHSKGKGGYVTAASTPKSMRYGYVFINCKLTGELEEPTVALGRPWRPYAKVIYIDCEMGAHIIPRGWNNWGKKENEKTALFAEFNSSGAGANPRTRVRWSKQLSDSELQDYKPEKVLGNWKPSF